MLTSQTNTKIKYLKSPYQVLQSKTSVVLIGKGSAEPAESGESAEAAEESPTARICITSAEDGRDCIVSGIRKIMESVQKGHMEPRDISYQFMDRVFTAEDTRTWPPPDFILRFGDSLVWNGFLPWHIRYSEILFVGDLKNIQFETFWMSLKTFDSCSRRFGK